jgi:hypothetical protein
MILEKIEKKYFSKALEKIIVDWYACGTEAKDFPEVSRKIKMLISVLFPPNQLEQASYDMALENMNITLVDGTEEDDDKITLMFTEPAIDDVLYFQMNFFCRGKFIKNPE